VWFRETGDSQDLLEKFNIGYFAQLSVNITGGFPEFAPFTGYPPIFITKEAKTMAKKRGRVQAKGYSEAGASHSRRALKGFIPNSGSPNEDINDNSRTLRQRSRMLYMSSPVATSAVNTNRTKIIGVGLTLKSSINREVLGLSADQAKEWQVKTENEFALWASKAQNCDSLGLNNFAGLQQLALLSKLQSGDVFVLFKREKPTALNPYSLRLHLIEADRISTPDLYGGLGSTTEGKNGENGNKIYDGVEVDATGKVVAYWIRNTYPFQTTSTETKWARIEAVGRNTGLPNVLHIMNSERPDQYRGVPYLAPVIEPLLQLRRYTESELVAALIQSYFTAWITTGTDQSENPLNEVGAGDIAGVPGANPLEENLSHSDNEYEMGPGMVTHLADGEDIKFGNPNIPTAGFETFTKAIQKQTGAGLELPYDVLLKEFNSSYSSSRGALLEAWEAFKMKRTWFIDDFCQPVYEAWIAEAVARGRIKAPGFWDDPLIRAAWCGARWIGPTQGQLDPKKEAEAAAILISHGIKTHEQVTREMSGGDWEANVEQLAHENELLRAAGCVPADVSPSTDEEDEEDEDAET
jgi:lambda family phage portal protein